jgi:uncharacterized surface protein with fasciclin (FAS1) repeats
MNKKVWSVLGAMVAFATMVGPVSASLTNTSSRGTIGTGSNVLINGFFVKAEPGELRWVLVRASGPTLASYGVPNTVADPSVWLYGQSNTVIGTNSSVGTAPNLALLNTVSGMVGAFPLTGANEAALLVGLPNGVYSAVARAESGNAGIGLLEVYDVAPVAPGAVSQTLSGLAAANPNLSTLATALRITGLDAVLTSNGPFTVFAPTNAAFAALPAGTLDSLIANPTQLANVLQYHVVSGKALSTSLSNGQQLTTLLTGAARLPVQISSAGVTVGGATVIAADVEAVNGVVHVIDRVLVP